MKYLVVDDEIMILRFLERFLEKQGHRVLLAETAQLGFELAVDEEPEVIITDYDLGDETGVAMLQRLQAALPGRPLPRIILMSGINPEFFRKLIEESNLDLLKLFLPKPFSVKQLRQLMPADPIATHELPSA